MFPYVSAGMEILRNEERARNLLIAAALQNDSMTLSSSTHDSNGQPTAPPSPLVQLLGHVNFGVGGNVSGTAIGNVSVGGNGSGSLDQVPSYDLNWNIVDTDPILLNDINDNKDRKERVGVSDSIDSAMNNYNIGNNDNDDDNDDDVVNNYDSIIKDDDEYDDDEDSEEDEENDDNKISSSAVSPSKNNDNSNNDKNHSNNDDDNNNNSNNNSKNVTPNCTPMSSLTSQENEIKVRRTSSFLQMISGKSPSNNEKSEKTVKRGFLKSIGLFKRKKSVTVSSDDAVRAVTEPEFSRYLNLFIDLFRVFSSISCTFLLPIYYC